MEQIENRYQNGQWQMLTLSKIVEMGYVRNNDNSNK
jgi:hypothetical protein